MFSAALACASAGVALAGAMPDSTRQVELAHLVRHDCGSCHGMTLKGGLGGPLLPPDLAHYSPEDVAGVILDGVPGTPMPPWRGNLTQEDALWIAERLKEGFPK
ncbi:MAG: c-type cytochrome [Hyphomicrobiales bacterium]